ncbi:hypothetical protein BH20ACT2_BH20ACT2_05780 [soil metagenome]
MAAPQYVPRRPMDDPRSYSSPPRRPESWLVDRPADLQTPQPHGDLMGHQGPDQGYMLSLARRFEGKLHLQVGEHEADVIAGGTAVALKRASLFGRAPVIHDLTAAFTIWGFLDEQPDEELVAVRRRLFAEVANPYHYSAQRAIADAVPDRSLHQPHTAIAEAHRNSWRDLLDLSEGT